MSITYPKITTYCVEIHLNNGKRFTVYDDDPGTKFDKFSGECADPDGVIELQNTLGGPYGSTVRVPVRSIAYLERTRSS